MTRSIEADDIERLDKLRESVNASSDIKEILTEHKSFHFEADFKDDSFVDELF